MAESKTFGVLFRAQRKALGLALRETLPPERVRPGNVKPDRTGYRAAPADPANTGIVRQGTETGERDSCMGAIFRAGRDRGGENPGRRSG